MSRAAEAAERAAVAATRAQTALVASEEDAMGAAEGRAGHAATLAKEAEDQAARSALSAVVYQDRAIAQATMAEEEAKSWPDAGRGSSLHGIDGLVSAARAWRQGIMH